MHGLNLIPESRRLAFQGRRRIRQWMWICAAYVGLLLLVAVGMLVTGTRGRADVERRIAQVHRSISDSEHLMVRLQDDLRTSEDTLATMRRIGPQPDWSTLLAMLARTLSDEVVLRRCTMARVGAQVDDEEHEEESSASGSGAVLIRIDGFGRSQSAVAEFVLRLNATTLIDSATLLRSEREPFLQEQAAAFTIECVIRTGDGGKR